MKKNDSRGAKLVDVHAGVHAPLHVLDAVAQRERELLRRRRAGLADVVAGDRDRVPLRHLLGAVADHVDDDPHARPRRVDVLLLGDELLEDVRLHRARQLRLRHALLLADQDVERDEHRRRRVDRHRGGDAVERDAVEQRLHVGERRDGDAALAHLAERQRVVGVAAHQRRQVEGDRQPAAAVLEQVLEARVRLGRAAVAGELAHRPDPAAVHRLVDAARVRVLTGVAEVALVVEPGDVRRPVHRLDRAARDRGEPRLARGRARGRLLLFEHLLHAHL